MHCHSPGGIDALRDGWRLRSLRAIEAVGTARTRDMHARGLRKFSDLECP